MIALLLVGVGASFAFADDVFAIAPSSHDDLVVFGPKGDRVAELSIPTISQVVTVGSTSFQISYGRDANNYITAIIAPSATQPQDLHFTVLNKTIEASKQSVVTLTFPDPKRVIVDPGYVGTVTVNSHPLRHRDIADAIAPPASDPGTVSTPAPSPKPIVRSSSPAPALEPVQSLAPRSTANIQPRDVPPPAPRTTTTTTVAKQSTSSTPPTTTVAKNTSEQPLPSASGDSGPTENEQNGSFRPSSLSPPPLLGSGLSQPPVPLPKGAASAAPPPKQKLFWAEPITPPNGTPPSVGIDEMKLVAVHGPVTVKLPNGDKKTGTEGMIIPSGTSITTSDTSSAAVFMGGVDSARFLPGTEAKVTQKLDGSTRKTDINLHTGTVFSRVGHRPGEKQDYQVRTPEGVAAARGTSYAVCVTTANGHQVTICATQEGVVTLTDSSNGHVITVTPQNAGQVSIGSVPGIPADTLRTIFVAFMTALQQFNVNMLAIANNPNPTAAESAYYNGNLGFDENTQFFDVNAGSLEILFLNPSSSQLFDNSNDINLVVPATRRASDQQLEPFGTIPLTPF